MMIEIKDIARELKLSTRQVRRIIKSMKLGPVRTVGRIPMFSRSQINIMKTRNTKPGFNGKGKRR